MAIFTLAMIESVWAGVPCIASVLKKLLVLWEIGACKQ